MEESECYICKDLKPNDDFGQYALKNKKQLKCKKCIKEYNSEYYKNNKSRIKMQVSKWASENKDKGREYSKKSNFKRKEAISNWVNNNRDKVKKNYDKFVKENPHKLIEYAANYRKRHPDRAKAHWAVCNAIRYGKLVKEPCAACGSIEGVEAHHPSYKRPLNVIWLCRKHHIEVHG